MATSPEELKTSLEHTTETPSFDWSTCPQKLYEILKAVSEDPESNSLDLPLLGRLSAAEVSVIVAFLNAHPRIKTLNLAYNRVGDEGAQVLAGNSTIETLNLGRSDIGDAGAQALAGNGTIKTLLLRGNCISNAGAEAFEGNATIETLNLACNGIGPAGAKALARNGTITSLDLSENRVGDEGAEAFEGNGTIKTLNMAATGLSDTGAQALARNSIIITLDVSRNHNIGDEGAKAFAGNETIKTLDMAVTGLSDTGAQAFIYNETLVNLRILHNNITSVCARALIQSYEDRVKNIRARRMSFLMGAKSPSMDVFFKNPMCELNLLGMVFNCMNEPYPVLEGSDNDAREALARLEALERRSQEMAEIAKRAGEGREMQEEETKHQGEEEERKVSQEAYDAMHADGFMPDEVWADDAGYPGTVPPPPPDYEAAEGVADAALVAALEASRLQFAIDESIRDTQAPVVIWTMGAPVHPVVPAAPPVTETPEQRRQKLSAACRRRGV